MHVYSLLCTYILIECAGGKLKQNKAPKKERQELDDVSGTLTCVAHMYVYLQLCAISGGGLATGDAAEG